MDTCQPQPRTLKSLVQEIIEWAEKSPIEIWKRYKSNGRRKRVYRMEIPCSLLDLRMLHQFFSIPGVDSEFLSARMYHQVWDCRFKPHKCKQVSKVVASLLQDLKEVFRVPKLQRDDENGTTLKKRVIITGFVELLGKLLINKANFSAPEVDEVMQELRNFVNIFWDKPFQATHHVLVQDLLAQFEGLLNEAGRFVYSIVFLSDPQVVNGVCEALQEPISLLKNNIIVFLSMEPNLVASKAIYRDVDSFFIVESLLHDLEDLLSRSNTQIVEVKDKIGMLHCKLSFTWSSLKEHLEVEEFKEIRIQIRDMAYEAEYLINSFLVGYVPAWYLTINISNIIPRIDLITAKIEGTKNNYDVEALNVRISSDAQPWIGTEVDEIVVGFEEEETIILDQLLGGTENLEFICIFGTAGLGKTTLAKKLFNSRVVGDRFDKRSWCAVSQTYVRKMLFIGILNGLEDGVKVEADEEKAASQIYKSLYGRRYLIVLDDIWDPIVWDDLRSCFPNVKNGSKILFTSRNKNAAPRGSIINALPFRTKDQCWELLQKKVFGSETCPPKLEGVGKEIAENCNGLPLVVAVITGILSMVDKEPSTWNAVAQDIGSYMFSDQNTSVMQILKLSYKHLPQYLKPCFLCFGVFSKDAEIPVKELAQLWIAERFIHIEKKRAEDIADDYLMELVNKSLVIISRKRSDGGAKVCVIHDLLHDMCLRVAEEENFLKVTYDGYPMRMKLRYSSLYLQPYGPWLRSFYCHKPYDHMSVINMKLLRVLDCWAKWDGYAALELVGLEHLANLRYLATRRVPKCIDSVVSLEHLIVGGQVCISSLILKMVKLRYLRATGVFTDNSCNSSKENNLEYLSEFRIRNLKDIKLLEDYPGLRRLKCSYEVWLPNAPLRCFNISFLDQLESFSIFSHPKYGISEIIFPWKIKKLTLQRFKFDQEMMSRIGALQNLEVLKLIESAFMGQRWDTKDDELKKLRFLKLDYINLVEWNVPSTQHFPSLQQLVLRHCHFLTKIPDEIGDIMTLQLIDVSKCPAVVGESAMQIQQLQDDLGNEGLTVNVQE